KTKQELVEIVELRLAERRLAMRKRHQHLSSELHLQYVGDAQRPDATKQRSQMRILGQLGDDERERVANPFAPMVVRPRPLSDPLDDATAGERGGGTKQLFARGKQAIDRLASHAGALGDLGERRAVVALLLDACAGDIDETTPAVIIVAGRRA